MSVLNLIFSFGLQSCEIRLFICILYIVTLSSRAFDGVFCVIAFKVKYSFQFNIYCVELAMFSTATITFHSKSITAKIDNNDDKGAIFGPNFIYSHITQAFINVMAK